MAIYEELFFNNLDGFISSGFPVLRQLFDEPRWHRLVRALHARASLPHTVLPANWAEFIGWLQDGLTARRRAIRPFLLDWLTTRWVELAHLSLAEAPVETLPLTWSWSPLAWPLAYRWPVHRLRPSHRPMEPPAEPTCLLVWRDPAERVRFLHLSPFAYRLAQRLSERARRRWHCCRLLRELAGSCGLSADVEYFGKCLRLAGGLARPGHPSWARALWSDDEDCLPAFTACPRRHPSSGFLAPLALRLYLAPVFWMAGCQKLADMPATIEWFGNPDWGLGLPFPELLAWLAALSEGRWRRAAVVRPGRALDQPAADGDHAGSDLRRHWPNGWQAIADPSAPFANAQVLEAGEKLARARKSCANTATTTG